MMMFILGILTGLVLNILVMVILSRYHTSVERTIRNIHNKTKEKGEVYTSSDEDESLEKFLSELPTE